MESLERFALRARFSRCVVRLVTWQPNQIVELFAQDKQRIAWIISSNPSLRFSWGTDPNLVLDAGIEMINPGLPVYMSEQQFGELIHSKIYVICSSAGQTAVGEVFTDYD